jgi:hypothetical protein
MANGTSGGARAALNRKGQYDQIRIVASPDGMFVKDARGGEMRTFGIDISLRPMQPPVMRINLFAGNFDVVGHPTFLVQDVTTGQPKAAKRIEYWDGTTVEFPEPKDAPAAAVEPDKGG